MTVFVLLCALTLSAQAAQKPEAKFSVTPKTGSAPLTVTFTDISTGGKALWKWWGFGDGTGSDSTAKTIKHTYSKAGTYKVFLKATNEAGSSTSDPQYITVSISDTEKQSKILNMANSYRREIPVELTLSIIRQEGGEGAFYIDSWAHNPSDYKKNHGPWAQPKNGDGVMQVTSASGYDDHKPYTETEKGYDGAINDGCTYLNSFYSTSNSLVYATLHYNTGPNSLYIYKGINAGDPQYLSHVATNLNGFVPKIYSIKNPKLVSSLKNGQDILNKYLKNGNIKKNQKVSYYTQYQKQLDAELNKL